MDHKTFSILNQSGFARRGRLVLAHGVVETPVFMPVGTSGVVKSLSTDDLVATGSQIILGNAYHLFLRPGLPLLEQFGGLHHFMGWNKPLLTDSGGFQVFSLGGLKQVTEEGVSFRSHLNGDKIFLTPELSAQIQQVIGSDIAMVLDECVKLPNTEAALTSAVERSFRWAKRFLAIPERETQKVFAIVQGGTDPGLRKYSLALTLELSGSLAGIAVGGLSVGESHAEMIATLQSIQADLPPELPHYLMGVGTPLDILEVAAGIDMFDCVLPTRNARNGGFFTDQGLLNIRNQAHQFDERPIADGCGCETCQRHSRAYLRHLFQLKEILGCRLATVHNVYYYHQLMSRIRKALEDGVFSEFYQQLRPVLKAGYEKTVELAPAEHKEGYL